MQTPPTALTPQVCSTGADRLVFDIKVQAFGAVCSRGTLMSYAVQAASSQTHLL